MGRGHVEVVAAASGTVVARDDGHFDQQCGRGLDEDRGTNFVSIAHDDGSVAIYAHLKRGSVTRKGVGEAVLEGERLGVVGSSGYSSYPHLHFEILYRDESVLDPYSGPANPTTDVSRWRDQAQRPDGSVSAEGVFKARDKHWAINQLLFRLRLPPAAMGPEGADAGLQRLVDSRAK